MSALTKEEREFMSVLVYDDRTTPLVSIIDRLSIEVELWKGKAEFAREGVHNLSVEVIRLSAQCEELEKESKDYFRIIEERGVQITDLCDKLTALIKAAEPIVSAMSDFDPQDSTDKYGIVDGHIMDKYGLADITIGDLRNLNAVVQKIKEEK